MTFLYPYFLLLLFVPVIFYFVSKKTEKNTTWAKICDAHLLPYLMVRIDGSGAKFYRRLMLFCWFFGCICLAGPALEKKIQTSALQSGLVVVVDMSPAMQGDSASEMIRKLYDLTDYQKDLAIGLVLADSQAYVALPITMDKAVFKNILPDLKENIMPSSGQNYSAGIDKAIQLLRQSGFKKGQILLLTAGTSEPDDLLKIIKKSPYPVSVIGVGNLNEQAPIMLPNGRFWGGNQPILVSLKGLRERLGTKYAKATLDESDLEMLIDKNRFENIEKSDNEIIQYQNLGFYGLLLLLPFVALLFRKGVLFVLFFCCLPLSAQAGFWWRTEQELYQKHMQGIADFNVGNYENAALIFENASLFDVEALYNLGNTFAYMGQFEKAIQTYEKVLSLMPEHFDAEYNLNYLKENLPPPPPQEQQAQGGQGQENQEQNSQEQNSAQADEKQQSENANNQSANQDDLEKNQNNSKAKAQENSQENSSQENNSNDASEEQQIESAFIVDEKTKPEKGNNIAEVLTPAEQKEKEWLDKVKSDAGQVLRYRLLRQYQELK